MRYSRKVIVGFIVLLAALMSPRLVFGDDDLVHVTPQIAVEQAQAFFDDVSDEPVTACDPVKMVNSDGESIGYIVRAKRDDVNYGYVVFDSERSWWISEYYLAPNALLPIERASEEIALLASSDNVVALKIDELTVGVADLDKNIVLDASGKKYQINCSREAIAADRRNISMTFLYLPRICINRDMLLMRAKRFRE